MHQTWWYKCLTYLVASEATTLDATKYRPWRHRFNAEVNAEVNAEFVSRV
jgi:hypothetical protein